MSLQTDNIKNLLAKFGLIEEEILLYLSLLEKSPQSALELSRGLNIGRTKIYRILDMLDDKGLVNVVVDEYGNKFEANSPKQLEVLLKEKEVELENIKKESESLFTELEKLKPTLMGETKILYYKGVEGLKQVTWNTLRTKDDCFRIYEIKLMHTLFDLDFSAKARAEFVQRRILVHQLTNHDYLESFTKVTQHIKDWTLKYIDPKELSIDVEVCIYNDVYVLYSYEKSNVFCVEIYNEKLAQMQKQIFDLIFKNATPMKILNDQGEAKLQ